MYLFTTYKITFSKMSTKTVASTMSCDLSLSLDGPVTASPHTTEAGQQGESWRELAPYWLPSQDSYPLVLREGVQGTDRYSYHWTCSGKEAYL